MNSFLPTTCTFLMLTSGLASLHGFLIQDFEVDAVGVTAIYASGEPETGNPIRVASGGINIPTGTSSSGGDYFAEVAMVYESGGFTFGVQGDRIKWNDGAQVGGFQSGYGHSVDVFFDDPFYYNTVAASIADGFYFQPTLLNDGNVGAVSGGGFAARLIDLGGVGDANDYVWRVGADGNSKGFTGVSGPTYDIDVALAGWYTMETIWVDDGAGNIDQVNTLRNEAGVDVLSSVFQDIALVADGGALGAAFIGAGDLDAAGAQVGPASVFGDLAIDNVSIVPEPQAYALLMGLLSLSFIAIRRRI